MSESHRDGAVAPVPLAQASKSTQRRRPIINPSINDAPQQAEPPKCLPGMGKAGLDDELCAVTTEINGT